MESKVIPVEKIDRIKLENEILYKSKLFSSSNYYTGNDLGLTYTPEKSIFKLWAPTAKLVTLHLYSKSNIDSHVQKNSPDRKIRMYKQNVHNSNSVVKDTTYDDSFNYCNELTQGIWAVEVMENLDGWYYTYSVKLPKDVSFYKIFMKQNELKDPLNGFEYPKESLDSFDLNSIEYIEKEAMDPYAKACSVNGHYAYICDLSKVDKMVEGWDADILREICQKKNPLTSPTDAIVYECHVRDMTMHPCSGVSKKGQYLGLTETGTKSPDGYSTGLDHICELGVTHVQLLPIYDYDDVDETKPFDSYNWGYNPLNYNIPEGSYATKPEDPICRIIELKTLIKTFHDKGIRVIMDVVYNHTFHTKSSEFNKIVPGFYYRMDKFGQFSDGSGCHNEIASERLMVRKYILDSVAYWVNEYHVDGFRFDLMGLIDTETMKAVREMIDQIDPNIIIYGEGWTGGDTPLIESKRSTRSNATHEDLINIGMFNDEIRDSLVGSVFNKYGLGFATGNKDINKEIFKILISGSIGHPSCKTICPRVRTPSQIVNYASCHDNMCLWDKICFSTTKAGGVSDEERIKMDQLAMAIVLFSQGIAFIHEGEEILRTKKMDENSYKSGDIINALDWSKKATNYSTFVYYKNLIKFRKEHPALRMNDRKEIWKNVYFMDIENINTIGVIIDNHANQDPYKTIMIFFNAEKEEIEVNLPQEDWSIVFCDLDTETDEVNIPITNKTSLIIPGLSTVVLADTESVKAFKK